jgi:hypothetical protein
MSPTTSSQTHRLVFHWFPVHCRFNIKSGWIPIVNSLHLTTSDIHSHPERFQDASSTPDTDEQSLLRVHLESPNSDGAIASLIKGHRRSAGCSSGDLGGKKTRWMPSGTLSRRVVWNVARSTTKITRLLQQISKCCAKSISTSSKTRQFSIGTIHAFGLSATRFNKSYQPQPLVFPIHLRQWYLTDRYPNNTIDWM